MVIKNNELSNEVQAFLDELINTNPKKESLEMYLINNLKIYLNALNNAETATQIKQVTERFDMFCIDSMNWDTPLFKRCTKITKLGLKAAKSS